MGRDVKPVSLDVLNQFPVIIFSLDSFVPIPTYPHTYTSTHTHTLTISYCARTTQTQVHKVFNTQPSFVIPPHAHTHSFSLSLSLSLSLTSQRIFCIDLMLNHFLKWLSKKFSKNAEENFFGCKKSWRRNFAKEKNLHVTKMGPGKVWKAAKNASSKHISKALSSGSWGHHIWLSAPAGFLGSSQYSEEPWL